MTDITASNFAGSTERTKVERESVQALVLENSRATLALIWNPCCLATALKRNSLDDACRIRTVGEAHICGQCVWWAVHQYGAVRRMQACEYLLRLRTELTQSKTPDRQTRQGSNG